MCVHVLSYSTNNLLICLFIYIHTHIRDLLPERGAGQGAVVYSVDLEGGTSTISCWICFVMDRT